MVLHAAGLLTGKRATTHWAHCDELAAHGDVTVLRHVRYVKDGNVVTSAGVSAGIDMSLWLVGQILGRETARNVQRTMEYDPAPPYAAET
jgi:transcriptional regulator GlxA family with amidase domain